MRKVVARLYISRSCLEGLGGGLINIWSLKDSFFCFRGEIDWMGSQVQGEGDTCDLDIVDESVELSRFPIVGGWERRYCVHWRSGRKYQRGVRLF